MNELEIELNNIDPQEFFTNENISSLRSHFPKLKIIQRGELFKVLGEKKSLNDFNKKFKYLTNYYSEFNSLNPNVIDEIIYNDLKYNGKDKVSLILHGVGGKPILAKTKKTTSPLIRLTIPPTTELTVEATSAILFLLDLVFNKNGDKTPRFLACDVFVIYEYFHS